ncbi:MAG: sugar transferase [Candidatus Colwellbacteria bacterium]
MSYPIWKKMLDIGGALTGLFVISPFIPLIALAIKLDSQGEVFIRLPRVSEGKVIKVYKFRSMIKEAHKMKADLREFNERDGYFFKMKHDPRVTRIGRILRRFRLDEFPQLINVLRGELALVGPRPHEPEEVAHYPEAYKQLLLARSGVTGLSQVNGASSLPFLKELELDSFYSRNVSPAMDFKILLKTALIFLFDPSAV